MSVLHPINKIDIGFSALEIDFDMHMQAYHGGKTNRDLQAWASDFDQKKSKQTLQKDQ